MTNSIPKGADPALAQCWDAGELFSFLALKDSQRTMVQLQWREELGQGR